MEKRIPLFMGGVVLLLVAFVLGAVLLDSTPLPAGEVEKIVAARSQSMFFDKNVIRIPAKGEIIPPIVENNGTIKAGVSVDTDSLNFGRIQSNLSGITRLMNVTCPFRSGRVRICVVAQGDIKPFLDAGDSRFIMSSGEKREVQIRFAGGEVGNHTGEVDVIAKKFKYDFLDILLPYVGC